jgi:hypothetical protein
MSNLTPTCNLCGSQSFADVKSRPLARCRNCGSYERTRLLYMFVDRFLLLRPQSRILHIAPERGMYSKLKSRLDSSNYVTADYSPENYDFCEKCEKIDLECLENWPTNQFDLIIHSHVLEHVKCNIAYCFFHIHRMLKHNGNHICVIPFTKGGWDESFQNLSISERIKRFGQDDHVRCFGNDDFYKYFGGIVRLPQTFDATSTFSADMLTKAQIPQSAWKGLGINSVLIFEKDDYLLR